MENHIDHSKDNNQHRDASLYNEESFGFQNDGISKNPRKDVTNLEKVHYSSSEVYTLSDSKEEDDSDNEDIPPLLKYKRLVGLPPRFFSKDPVSTCCINENVLIFATHSGILHLCQPDFTPIRTFKAHNSSVFSIDSDGEHFISGSIDGTVVIGSIATNDVTKYDFKRPIQAVSFDRLYKRTGGFFCGGTSGQLIYSTRNWLGQRSDLTIDENGGTITMIRTIDDIVIWCNDKGITIAQTSTKQHLLHIKVPQEFQRPELYWPRVHCIDKDRLLLAWVNHMWLFRVSISEKQSLNLASAAGSFKSSYNDKKVEIEHHIVLEDTMIAGVSDFNDELMIINYIPKKDKRYSPPELKVLDRDTLDELSVDEIELKNYEGLSMNDYHLYSSLNNKWLLVSSNDAIIIEEYTLNDKLEWFLSRKRFLDAWNLSGLWLDKYEKLSIAQKQLETYFSSEQWNESTEFMSKAFAITEQNCDQKYLEKMAHEWDDWLYKLRGVGQLAYAADYIPSEPFVNGFCQANKIYYESILTDYLNNNEIQKFKYYFNKWDHKLFSVQDIKLLIEDYLNIWDRDFASDPESVVLKSDVTDLRKEFINVCLELDEPENCVSHKMKLQDSHLLEFLDEYHLIHLFIKELPRIMLIGVPLKLVEYSDPEELAKNRIVITNIKILIENSHEILPNDVVNSMKDSKLDVLSYLYLEELGKVDKLLIKNFEDEMVELYAKFNNNELYEFITKHKSYSIDKAIAICERYNCIEELVYLFSKVGQNQKALTLIVDDLKDPDMAINFAHKINDQALWDFLLDHTMSRSDFIKALLVSSGEWIDPLPVVSRIPEQVEIEGLKEALVKITAHGKLDEFIYKIIEEIITMETFDISYNYRLARTTAAIIDRKYLEAIQKDPEQTYIKYTFKDGIHTEKSLIGTSYKAQGNKITHKAYTKLKLSKN